MKVLLIGATGLLGRKILSQSPNKTTVIPTYYQNNTITSSIKLDITQSRQVNQAIKTIKPNVVIHAASLGNVDYCQKYPQRAWQVNVIGTSNVCRAAKKNNAKLIFFSSNAVFDGQNPPYNESSIVKPINYYGKTKVAAEKCIQKLFPDAMIIRLMTMYGWNDSLERQNPATWLIDRLKNGQKTPVVNDIHNNYLWAGHAAKLVWKAIAMNKFGQIFHAAGKECINRFDFAKLVVKTFRLNKQLIYPVTSSHFKHLAPRPKNTCFDTSKMKHQLQLLPLSIGLGLKTMKKESPND